MSIDVRPARPTDLAFLVDGNARMALETEHRELDRTRLTQGVEAALADGAKGRYFVAEAGGIPLGQLLITREWSDWRCGWFWWIQSVYVMPEARGRGVFAHLYRAVLEAARVDPEVCGVRLYVETGNERAQAIYRHLGMADAGYRVFEVDFRSTGR